MASTDCPIASGGPKPWDLEVIRNERAGRRKVELSEISYEYNSTSNRPRSIVARTDGTSDNEGAVTNPFWDAADDIAPDDHDPLASPTGSEINTVKIVTSSGTFAVAVASPPLLPPERQSSKRRTGKSETRYQGLHPFVPGKVNHNYPGGTNRRHFKQYVYSSTQPEYAMTHHYLCETSDLEKPIFYYHDVGGYTRLDRNHRFTLHWGGDFKCPVLGTMWHTSSGMNFAVGTPTMSYTDRENEEFTAIQRQHCDFFKPISTPSRWHMDFTFGGGIGEGPERHYRWQVEHLDRSIPHLRHAKLELREKVDGVSDGKGREKKKGKLFAACRNVENLNTNLWVRHAQEDFNNAVAQVKWQTWILLTWGAMRDRMRGPHNTGSPHHNVGYTKTRRAVELSGDGPAGCMSPPRSEHIRERTLNSEEY
ncbi:uncharacterized protein RSE6_03207 [Rhynchosporium secalis]|uniref:Uncharacterized protein n=1 Tax=Rhynchosporium secalis TaxID=38038 RepID=A0A1E1M2A2_RHYSE|nr:uncharacterized protein RSE6_03207 [Rhynchosporium secalis]